MWLRNQLITYIYLLLLAPIPAALTYYGSPNIHRSVFLSVLLVIPVAFGVYKIAHIQYGKILILGLGIILCLEVFYFWHQYETQGDIYTADRRNDGQNDLILYLEDHVSNETNIYLPNEGTMSLYVALNIQNFNSNLSKQFSKDVKIAQIENYFFTESICPTKNKNIPSINSIAVNRSDCIEITYGWKEVARIYGKSHLLGYIVYSR